MSHDSLLLLPNMQQLTTGDFKASHEPKEGTPRGLKYRVPPWASSACLAMSHPDPVTFAFHRVITAATSTMKHQFFFVAK